MAAPHASFVEVSTRMLAAQGLPRTEPFAQDDLHLSASGYHQLWSALLRPELDRRHAEAAAGIC